MENTQTMDMGLLANKMRQIKSPRRHDPIGEPEGVISNPNQFDPTYHSDYVMICKEIADILTKRYPGWLWAVKPNQTGRVIDVFCMQLHDAYGYTIRMVDILHDPRRKQA
jgi:hypothetical protein